MKQITLYSANCRQNKYNTNYPNKQTITTEEQLKAAVKFDHVFAAYKSGHRSIDDFIRSDCLPFDCDNDHSETASEWKTAADVAKAFEGVPFYVVYSRYLPREKDTYPCKRCGESRRRTRYGLRRYIRALSREHSATS